MVQVWRVPFAPPGAQVVWSRGGRVSENGYASPFGRYVFVIASEDRTTTTTLGASLSVPAEDRSSTTTLGASLTIRSENRTSYA